MVQWGIETYARVRPTRPDQATSYRIHWQVTDEAIVDSDEAVDVVELIIPQDALLDYANNQKSSYKFQFSKCFHEETPQEEVFEQVCKSLLLSALDGYNATIFAYGQTGSGKTFTMTGGDQYKDRGIVPRTVAFVFEEFDKRKDSTFSCYISYMEIYNENVYDLLERSHRNKTIEQWQRVQLMNDEDGDIHFRNLGVYEALTEEEALNLFFIGNVNRVTSSTQMNQASSRSHAIFSLVIEGRHKSTEIITSSKIHLVDLAGSERVYRREGNTQKTQNEGKYINLSLHYLEKVILALQAKEEGARGSTPSQSHVPFRNSMLTSVLRGSLGGNCKSVFIATLNPEIEFLDESISTCRFAQRCSQLTVNVSANEELDPVAKLRRTEDQNRILRKQLKEAQAILNVEKDHKSTQVTDRLLQEAGMRADPQASDATEEERDKMDALTQLCIDGDATALDQIRDEGMNAALACVARLIVRVAKHDSIGTAGSDPRRRLVPQTASNPLEKRDKQLNRGINDDAGEENDVVESDDSDNSEDEHAGGSSSVDEREEEDEKEKRTLALKQQNEPLSPRVLDGVESTSQAIKRKIKLLTNGGLILKHGRLGKPHVRYLWVSSDLKYLQYRKVGEKIARMIILTSTIQRIVKGHTTKVFSRTGKTGTEDLSFSIIYDNEKTLNVQIDEGDDAIQNKKRRDEWLEALQFLIKLQSAQDGMALHGQSLR